jgi:hypothetical protein
MFRPPTPLSLDSNTNLSLIVWRRRIGWIVFILTMLYLVVLSYSLPGGC